MKQNPPPTSKEMKEIHFIGKLGSSTLAPWDDPAHLKQPGSYHSLIEALSMISDLTCSYSLNMLD